MNSLINTAQQKHVLPFIALTAIVLGVVAARKLVHSDEPRVDAPTSAGKVLHHKTGFQTDRLPRTCAGSSAANEQPHS